jgi:hypothetical protein
MFNWFKKKSDLENVIAKKGFAVVTADVARLISKQLSTDEIAYQFVLEELEAASKGNEHAQAFAQASGIDSLEYLGSMDDSRPEVDGPGGPQQTVLALCMQLRGNTSLMVRFRTELLDRIMRERGFGRHATDGGPVVGDSAGSPISASRIDQIAAHVLDLSQSCLEMVGSAVKQGNAQELVLSCAGDIRDDVFNTYDTKVVGLAVMQCVARNGVQSSDTGKKTACMLAMSVIWAVKKMEEEAYALSENERTVVLALEADAREVLMKHRSVIDVTEAKLWIATTLASDTAQLSAT